MLLLHCAALNEAMSDIFGAPVEHELDRVIPMVLENWRRMLRLAPQGDASYMNNPKVETTSVDSTRYTDRGHRRGPLEQRNCQSRVLSPCRRRNPSSAAEVGSEVDPRHWI
jgi:hypothetical protein